MARHEDFIRRCIELSYQAREKRNAPFASLLVIDEKIVLEAENTVSTEQNPLGHSELNLIIAAVKRFPREALQRSILYASAEPCVMCSGAIFNSPIRQVAFGASAASLSKYFPDDPNLSCRDIFATSRVKIQVDGPILEAEALKAHEGFWS
jgi:tRNA(Arg) A34 adenosine deaminase TadA